MMTESVRNRIEEIDDVDIPTGEPLRGIDFCAGSGIGSAAFSAIGLCRTVLYVERDPYCQRLIQQRIADGWLDDAPLWDDATTLDGRPWRGVADFVFGGIPCQPWSVAGKRRGAIDSRDLIGEFVRVVREVGPRVVLVENTPGFTLCKRGGPARRKGRARVVTRWYAKAQQSGVGRLLGLLAEAGYDAEWHRLSARAVGAHHRRDRVWVVAYAQGVLGPPLLGVQQDGVLPPHVADAPGGGQPTGGRAQGQAGQPDCGGAPLANANGEHAHSAGSGAGTIPQQRPAGVCDGWWELEPDVDRVADGVSSRVDRLRTIGNGWVPQVAAVIGLRIMSTLGMPKEVVSK